MTNLRRLLMLAVAIGLTLAVFEFWGRLGSAMGIAIATKVAQPAPQQTPGEVSVIIVPPPSAQGVCGKDRKQPCPPVP
ncbi:MAG TPA: hypothetical protein VIM02_15870 [Rhizomicrobium sp.]|jgi:hypothetical protein